MKKQFLVEIEYEANEPNLVTAIGLKNCIKNMMDGYIDGLVEVNETKAKSE